MAQTIEIVRGSTETLQLTVTDSERNPYNLGSNERIVLAVKAKPEKDAPLILAKTAEVIGAGLFKFKFSPEDTEPLDYGRYYYDVSLDDGTDFFPIIRAEDAGRFVVALNCGHRGCAV
jgi:hypothetical protein